MHRMNQITKKSEYENAAHTSVVSFDEYRACALMLTEFVLLCVQSLCFDPNSLWFDAYRVCALILTESVL